MCTKLMGSVMRINLNNYQIKPLHDSRSLPVVHDSRSLPVDTQRNNDVCREGVRGTYEGRTTWGIGSAIECLYYTCGHIS